MSSTGWVILWQYFIMLGVRVFLRSAADIVTKLLRSNLVEFVAAEQPLGGLPDLVALPTQAPGLRCPTDG